MDAYDIALLMANQHDDNPLRLRYGTVSACGPGQLQVVPDGHAEEIPAIRCCNPTVDDRVVLLVSGTEWLAVSTIGGDSPLPLIGQPFITALDEVLMKCGREQPGASWKTASSSPREHVPAEQQAARRPIDSR